MMRAKRFEVSPTGCAFAPKDWAIFRRVALGIGDVDVVVAERAERQHDAKADGPRTHHEDRPRLIRRHDAADEAHGVA
ncbi:hypothetical protein ACVWZR_001751 [Bradyrhizobium sp. i1.3.1]